VSRARKILRRAFKVLLGLVAFVVLLVVGLAIFKDSLIKAVARQALREETGMEVVIGQLKTELGAGTMTLSGFQLLNPPEFGDGVFVDISEVHAELDAEAAKAGRVHFKVLRFNLALAQVVKNKDGKTNLEYLDEHTRERARLKKKKKKPHEKERSFDGIDTFYFSLGKMKYIDLKNPRNNLEFECGLKDEVAKDLKSEEELSDWVTTKLFGVILAELLRGSGKLF
jgi:uncharacterized protein involved in outer membrane biogenesis